MRFIPWCGKRDDGVYELSKFASWMVSPLLLTMLGGFLALGMIGRGWLRAGVVLGAVCMAGLWLLSTPWVAWRLALSLERRFPPVAIEASPSADAALVLGGALRAAEPPGRPHVNLGSAADRVWHAAELYRASKVRWVLLTGGHEPSAEHHAPPEAAAVRQLLPILGVPDSAIRHEIRSRNTRENAIFSQDLVRQVGARRVLLVTSALHMPRAMAIFSVVYRDSGVAIVPASTDAEALGDKLNPRRQWLPDAASLEWSSRSIKEYQGLLAVWWTDRLF